MRNLGDTHIRNLLAAGSLRSSNSACFSASWQPPDVEFLQRELPGYEVSEFIARGGMGAVYRGVQKSLKRSVAIKILPRELGEADTHFSERFTLEAQMMARLSHPNIVTVYDAGVTPGGLLYFVMEYVEGTDVAKMIASEGRLPLKQCLEIAQSVCEALIFAHEEGIIHRDIKPSNVMVDRKGRVRVADFGLAKTLDVPDGVEGHSQWTLGTVNYIAPENLTSGTSADHRADVYSVGVMLYQMLTGQIPKEGFETPSKLDPDMDERLDAIVDRALQIDREHRYSSAFLLKQDLLAIATAPYEAGLSEPKKTRRRIVSPPSLRYGSWIGGSLILLLLVLFFDFVYSPREEQRLPETGWISLIPAIEQKHFLRGAWRVQGKDLVCSSPQPWALCELPVENVEGSYDLRVEMTRGHGSHRAFYLPFRKGEVGGIIGVDYINPQLDFFSDGRHFAGIEYSAGQGFMDQNRQGVKHAPILMPGKKSTVLLHVRGEGIAIHVDGSEIYRRAIDWPRLKQSGGALSDVVTGLGKGPVFGVGIYNCPAVFHKIEFRRVSGPEGINLPAASAANAEVISTPIANPQPHQNWIDAMKATPLKGDLDSLSKIEGGYILPRPKDWRFGPVSRASALHVRGKNLSSTGAGLGLYYEDGTDLHVNFSSQHAVMVYYRRHESLVPRKLDERKDITVEGLTHDYWLWRMGGRLIVGLNDQILFDQPDPSPLAATMALRSHPTTNFSVEKVEYRSLDNLTLKEAMAQACLPGGTSLVASEMPASSMQDAPIQVLSFGGHRYQFIRGAFTWMEAKTYAEEMGGHLATLTTPEESDWALRTYLTRPNTALWLGGRRGNANRWYWITGEPWVYEGWAKTLDGQTALDEDEPGTNSTAKNSLHLITYAAFAPPGGWDNRPENRHPAGAHYQNGFLVEWDHQEGPTASPKLSFKKHHYQFIPFAGDWLQAKKSAEALGGHLVTITDPTEHGWFLQNMAGYAERIYLGGQRSAKGPWQWVTGERWQFTAWGRHTDGQTEPREVGPETEARLEFVSSPPFEKPGGWNDADVTAPPLPRKASAGFVVEWEDPPVKP